jgi:hypothetical protein
MENLEVRFTVFRGKNDPSWIYISYQPVLRGDWVNAIDFDSIDNLKNALLSVPLPQEIADNKHPGEPHEVTWLVSGDLVSSEVNIV